MNEWTTIPLGSALTFQRGFDITKNDQQDGPFAVISSSGPSSTHAEFKVVGPGVVIGRKGSLGTVYFSAEPFWPHDTTLWVKDFHGNDPRFAYYFLQSMHLERLDAGASNPSLNRNHVHTIPVYWPRLPQQRRIAGVLSAYDDLIENCERRIRVLDDMARGLYREWFVNFRYPRHETVPLVESPLGRIPKGWSIVSVDAVKGSGRYAVNGGPFGSKLGVKDYVPDGVPVIRGSNLTESGRFRGGDFVFVSAEKAQELSANLARPGDIVVTQRGTLGQVGMIPIRVRYETFVISQSQMKITLDEEKVDRTYAFFALSSSEARQRIKNLASSSGVPHINLGVLREFLILSPPLPLQRRFAELARNTEDLIESLNEQASALRKTRDLLLPRLLSGQLLVEGPA
jgi:type I restriction enzyme S subunit